MAGYEFVTIWRIEATLPEIWDAICHSECWPEWWRGLQSVCELEKGSDRGVGNLRRYSWQGALPYQLTFDIRTTCVEHLHLIEGTAAGDLAGSGTWRFAEEEGLTVVRCEWRVRTTKFWMNFLAPVARPLFRWNHDKIMRWGETGLARRLGARIGC